MNLYKHQRDVLAQTRDLPHFALFWEMGLGKSRAVVETYKALLAAGKVKRLAIIAPNGLHQAWMYDELAKSLPEVPAMAYDTHKSGKRWLQHLAFFLTDTAPAVLTISYDALLTKRGKDALETFLNGAPCLLVADESSRIKNPKAKRTKTLLKLAGLTRYKRILTGTPAANSPFDLYSQFLFLDADFWKRQGIANWWAFRARYGRFEKSYIFAHGASRDFMKLVGYQNEAELATRIAPMSSRLKLAECVEMPDRVFEQVTFDLTPTCRKLYDTLKAEFFVELEGGVLTASLALTRLLRLQQIASGILKPDNAGATQIESGRLTTLQELLEDWQEQTIIWCRFAPTAKKIAAWLGPKARLFDGSVSQPDRLDALQAFDTGRVQFIVANIDSLGAGYNLQVATRAIFVERSFSLEKREQALGRNYRIGSDKKVVIVDLIAKDSVDEHLMKALISKQNLSDLLMGGLTAVRDMV